MPAPRTRGAEISSRRVHASGGEARIPGLRDVIELFDETGNWKETAEIFGLTNCASIRWRAREEGKALACKVIDRSSVGDG